MAMSQRSGETGLFLHPLLQTGAILQRDCTLLLTGWAFAVDTVAVDTPSGRYEAAVEADGQFRIELEGQPAGGPHQLRFWTASEERVLDDIYFGDVYLAGGQSNMEWPFGNTDELEVDRSKFQDNLLRATFVPQRETWPVDQPIWTWTSGPWQPLVGEALDAFSAVAAYAGYRLRELDPSVPIGLVGAYKGATSATCWTSKETLAKHPNLAVYQEEFLARIQPWSDRAVYEPAMKQYVEDSERWHREAAAYRLEHPHAIEADLTAVLGPSPWPPPENEDSFMRPSGLYQTMLEPLRFARFKEAIFYQGEADLVHPELYTELLGAMHDDWTELFGDIRITQVQLPSYEPNPQAGLTHHVWGLLREAQRQASVGGTGFAHIVALDESDINDLHPRNKRLLGLRMGEWLGTAEALDLHLRAVHREANKIELELDVHQDLALSFESREDVVDVDGRSDVSGFELILEDQTRLNIPTQWVELVEGGIQIQLEDGFVDERASVKLSYGGRNDSYATVFARARVDGPKSELAELYGNLEAFIVDLS